MKQILITAIAAVLLVGCEKSPSVDIWTAAAQGNIELVKRHLDAGEDVNEKNKVGMTPLHYASIGHMEVVELLITNGANVNAKSEFQNFGETPLHHAAWGDYKEIVKLLITKGADVNAIIESGSFRGMTSLGRAKLQKQHELADLLRKHGGKTGKELKAVGK